MLVKSKKNLESKCVKQDEDLRESTELYNGISQRNAKFERMLSMGKSVGDKRGLGYPNENTQTSCKTIFVKCITNLSTPQVGTSSKFVKNGKGRNSKNKVAKEAQIIGVQHEKMASLSGRVNSSEEGTRGHQVDLVKSKA
ncbi:unnamed protein product [Ilex paraguariensis]|uniref:Uncharacterized protein n=1 Tax=Ilex paraguariensis TaxID=185542 RepID=A0ABC8RC77_9AQUA